MTMSQNLRTKEELLAELEKLEAEEKARQLQEEQNQKAALEKSLVQKMKEAIIKPVPVEQPAVKDKQLDYKVFWEAIILKQKAGTPVALTLAKYSYSCKDFDYYE